MLNGTTLDFLKKLKENNHKEWFDANKKQYEAAKQDYLKFLTGLLLSLSESTDPSLCHLSAKDCMFRINRDVRFSKDKSPYKTNFGASICKGGKKALLAGYYLHCEPGGQSFIAGGIWMPMAPELKKIRQEIDYSLAEFRLIVEAQAFQDAFGRLDTSEGGMLSRPPKGYTDDNPALPFLKLKSFIASCPIGDDILTGAGLQASVAQAVAKLRPLVDFLNRALEG